MGRYICIHGHFYQPPRENPWLEEVEIDDSAYPYHDWNSRVTAECYAPNAASRILDPEKRIIDIVNNYATISFNFGATLFKWLERKHPEVYSAILEADKESMKRFSGHGSAIAQVYNHMILPLANSRDKRTQVVWGIQDFLHRFGRKPEGMWLAETAVDLETLGILAEEGILFTILSPHQALQVKKFGDISWTDVTKETLDTSRPYLCRLPNGKSITLFFYDDPFAQDVAFGDILNDGGKFAEKMSEYFSGNGTKSGLLSIVSDGETYGHHHRFADMALAYALYRVKEENLATITIFGEYLANNPPSYEVRIREYTSWSCPHGVERWRSDCGCSTWGTIIHDPEGYVHVPRHLGIAPVQTPDSRKTWHQTWRQPLREALNRLRDLLIPLYETRISRYIANPWFARDDYISVVLDRSRENTEHFFLRHARRELSPDEKSEVLSLLEMQRNALLMFSSCGWFFDDIAGIETVQVLKYACRAIQLAKDVSGTDFGPWFMEWLSGALSNVPEHRNGAYVYKNYVMPSTVDLPRIAFHDALCSLIIGPHETPCTIRYTIEHDHSEKTESDGSTLIIGSSHLQSDITWEEKTLEYAVVRLGEFDFLGGVREHSDTEEFLRIRERMRLALGSREIPLLITILETEFATKSYTLWHLFRDSQREVLSRLLVRTLSDLETSARKVYHQNSALIHAMNELHIPVPGTLKDPVWSVLNSDLNTLLSEKDLDLHKLHHLINEIVLGRFSPDTAMLNFTVSNRLRAGMKKIHEDPENLKSVDEILALFSTLDPMNLTYDLWECQNDYFHIGREMLPIMQNRFHKGDAAAETWIAKFEELGTWLGVKIP